MRVETGWNTISNHVHEMIDEFQLHKKEYDVIVGIGRGGLVPAIIFSHQLGVPLVPVLWQTRDVTDKREDLTAQAVLFGAVARMEDGQRILVVDDIADTGVTLSQVADFLDKTQYGLNKNIEIDTATVYAKPQSKFKPTYVAEELDDNEWVVFPWEAE